MKLKIHEYDLQLKYKFGISRETRSVQKSMIVEIQDGLISGLGEAVADHKYYTASNFRKMEELIRSLKNELASLSGTQLDPEAFWEKTKIHFQDNPHAHCALDMALWDLKGKIEGKSVRNLWQLDPGAPIPDTNYTVGIDNIDVMVKKLKEFRDWPLFKIKLGTEHDLKIMEALRRETDAVLRIDANCAWTPEQTIRYSEALAKLNVEFIEQPLPAHDWEGMAEVMKYSKLPIIADESCVKEDDVERCRGFFHGVNIKVFKCGGLTPARRMAVKARELGMKVMAGCMTESSVGVSGIAQLLPLLDFVDIDGPLLLAEDIADGVKIDKGKVSFPELPGTGVTLR